jgi:UDP-N-acetylmuramate dehydrogenase
VTRVWFRLSLNPVLRFDYGSLKEEADKLGGVTLKNMRQVVINIRKSKLPDPGDIGNAGSFFKNPVVPESVAQNLKKTFPDLPCHRDTQGKTKLAAGWIIEQCGWKGFRRGDAAVHEKQALVLVNHGNATGKEIFDLSEKIRSSVLEKFGISLEREVEVIGTT